MKAKVLKALVFNGKKIEPGTTVDVSNWRNQKTLVSGRYIEILDESEIKETPKVSSEIISEKPKTTAKIKQTKEDK